MHERILVIDDEPDMLQMIADALATEGYVIDTATSGEEGLRKADLGPDLVILDVMLPGADGYAVCGTLRDRLACPIVFLSALDAEADRVRGLATGGDDYLSKPFGIRELRERVRAHLRREERSRSPRAVRRLRFGELSIDVQGRTVRKGREEILFTRREFDIVELLALNPGQVFTKEQIYEKIWGYDADGDASTVTEHVKRIRSKLGAAGVPPSIATLWGVGYKWAAR